MTTNTNQRAPHLPPHQRRWQDLQGWRLCLAFVLGPVACAVPTVLFALLNPGVTGNDIMAMVTALIFFGALWQMLGGWAYLLLVARARRRIGRSECVLLGTGLMTLLPALFLLVIFAGSGADGAAAIAAGFTPPRILVSLGIFLIFGLISGWALWRIGVRPAPSSTTGVG